MSPGKPVAMAVMLLAGAGWYLSQPEVFKPAPAETPLAPAQGFMVAVQHVPVDAAAAAFSDRAHGRMIVVQGQVTRLLADDDKGSPHQRFVIRTAGGQTLLVSHNLDLAPRLNGLRVGDAVGVHGEYEWNAQGGLLHWTHDDPNGQHAAGYIDWKGQRYQ
jgi:Protein of unknown function (DUF3465)